MPGDYTPWKPARRKIGHVLLAAGGERKIIHNLPLTLLHGARRNEQGSITVIDVGSNYKRSLFVHAGGKPPTDNIVIPKLSKYSFILFKILSHIIRIISKYSK